MERNWYKIAFYAAVVLNLILLAEVYQLKFASAVPDQPSTEAAAAPAINLSEYMSRTSLPDVTVIDSTGRTVSVRQLVERYAPVVIVFFTPADCHTCLEERSLWGEIPRRSGIPMIGVASNADVTEYREWAAQVGFPVPIFIDTSFAILDSMQIRVRPLKVLFDRRGEAVWADGTRLEPQEQAQFWPLFQKALAQVRR